MLLTTTTRPSRRRITIATAISPRRQLSAPTVTDTQLASACASIISRIILHPIDCIKIRMQFFRDRPDAHNGLRNLIKFLSTEGIPGLYRGIVGALIGTLPYSMVYMPSYELAQNFLSSNLADKQLGGIRHFLAGSIAGFCGSLVKVPTDVVKKRLQAGIYPNLPVALTSIVRDGNRRLFSTLSLFYTGWTSSIMYEIPYNAVQFTVLENVRNMVKKLRRKEKLVGFENGLVGAMTGMITSIITEPFDVVKTRLMTQSISTPNSGLTIYKGWTHCISTIIKEEGIISLWKGTLPRLVWVGTSSAIWYGTYQAVCQAIASQNDEKLKAQ